MLTFSLKSFVFPSHIKKMIKIYKTVIFPVVLYGSETWSLTLKEKHKLRVLGTVSRKIFGPKGEEDRSWRKLHNDELHSLYSSLNIIRVIKFRRMRWERHVACMGRGEVFTELRLGGPKGTDHWEDLGICGRITLRWTSGRYGLMG
jgi:hypothetical protein